MKTSVGNTAERYQWIAAVKLCMIVTVLTISACSTTGESTSQVPQKSGGAFGMGNPVAPVDRTILNDMTAIVVQIFDPIETTLQVNEADNDPNLQYFIDSLADNGYGIQRVSADQGANYVSYTRNVTDSDPFREISFSVTIGAVVVSRDYSVPRRNVVAPASVVRLSGTRVPVTIDDKASGRKRILDPSLSTAVYVASLSLDEQSPVISLITPQLVERVSARSAEGPTLQALNSSKIEVNNLFYGGDSTFSSLLDNYSKIDRQVIVFGNDSMVLGETNKSLIDQFVTNQFSRGDIVSLVGCSNGPTSLEIGNEGLALGRARRVTEALLARGIARDNVLDEGCWAPVNAGDRFPSRGVVMELWRSNT